MSKYFVCEAVKIRKWTRPKQESLQPDSRFRRGRQCGIAPMRKFAGQLSRTDVMSTNRLHRPKRHASEAMDGSAVKARLLEPLSRYSFVLYLDFDQWLHSSDAYLSTAGSRLEKMLGPRSSSAAGASTPEFPA